MAVNFHNPWIFETDSKVKRGFTAQSIDALYAGWRFKRKNVARQATTERLFSLYCKYQ